MTFLFLALSSCSVPLSAEEKVSISTNGVEIKFNALTQIWFSENFQSARTAADIHTYRLRRSELKFSGKIENEKVGWLMMLDPAERPSSPLQDLYVDLRYIPKTEFRAGQFKIPFSMEALTSSGQLDFTERALVVRTFANKRDIGAILSGKFKRFEYYFGEFNGTGQNTSDNNPAKDVVARIVVKPATDLAFGGSGYWGSVNGNTVRNGRIAFDYQDLWRAGTDLRFDYHRVSFRSEAIWARSDSTFLTGSIRNPRVEIVRKKQWGGYSSASLKFFKKHQFGIRLEWFDPNTNIGRDVTFISTLGYNFLQTPRLKWQINLQSEVLQQGLAENNKLYFGVINLQVSF